MNIRRRKIKNNKKYSSLIFIIIFLSVGAFFTYNNYKNFSKKELITETRTITIEETDRFANLGEKIPEFDSMWYKLYLRNNEPDYTLKEGVYEVEKGQSIEEALVELNTPIFNSEDITILEGWNIFDIDKRLVQLGLASEGDYISYVQNPEKIEALKEYFPFLQMDGLTSLEGYLYPETYKVNPEEFSINILVIAQLEQFETTVYEPLLSSYSPEKIYEIVNLASIVQKEEKNSAEKATVAGILKKRLNENWMIGADATVCYPYKLTSNECKMVVSKYIYEKNDYNTRTMTGLPKTPISNPEYETIEATVNSKQTPYYFYLHDVTTGQIYYAETNAQHEVNKSKYIK